MLKWTCTLLTCLALLSAPGFASANTEPTAYDTRSVALGLTGVAYLENPGALAINPALMSGINKFGFSFMSNTILVNTQSPVSGPGTNVETGISPGPMGALFLGGRVAPRVVFGGGIYLEQGYGATFNNVPNIDGRADAVQGMPTSETLEVIFFVGEVAVGTSIELTDKLSIGAALRVPFSRQDADLYQNVLAALGGIGYDHVKNKLSGIGFPSPRFGIAYKPTDNVSLGVMYRVYTKIRLTGTTQVEGLGVNLKAEADWVLPHALQFGGAFWFLDRKLMLAAEGRLQFHGADKHGNESQTVRTFNDDGSPSGFAPVIAPFDWKTIWSAKIGAEYNVSELFVVRAGFNAAVSNVRRRYAQYFTPPPGFSPAYSAGFGFNWEHFELNFATLMSFQNQVIDESVSRNPDGSSREYQLNKDTTIKVCDDSQVLRTGCAGRYKTRSYWVSVNFTYMR